MRRPGAATNGSGTSCRQPTWRAMFGEEDFLNQALIARVDVADTHAYGWQSRRQVDTARASDAKPIRYVYGCPR
jgi:hypothetical protein